MALHDILRASLRERDGVLVPTQPLLQENDDDLDLQQKMLYHLAVLSAGSAPAVDYETGSVVVHNDGGYGDELHYIPRFEDGVLQPVSAADYFQMTASGLQPYAGTVSNPSTTAQESVVKAVYRLDGNLSAQAVPSIAPYPASGSAAARTALHVPSAGDSILIDYPHYGVDVAYLRATSADDGSGTISQLQRNGLAYNPGSGGVYGTSGRYDYVAADIGLIDQHDQFTALGECYVEITVKTTKAILNSRYP